MTGARLVVRADARAGLGAGHVARQLALVQAWVDRGGSAALVSHHAPPFWRDRYEVEGAEVVEPAQWPGAEGGGGGPGADRPDGGDGWAVVDGYGHSSDERDRLRTALGHLLVVDDHALSPPAPADLVVDQNLGARAEDYADVAGHPRLLLGPRYALVRREFRTAVAERDELGIEDGTEVRRVAVGWGGAPTDAVRSRFAEVGNALEADGFEVERLDGVDVAAVLGGVDLVVSAAGSITWEIATLGVPAILVPVAPNQDPVAARMGEAGAAEVVGSSHRLPSVGELVTAVQSLASRPAAARRHDLAVAARELADGLGAVRVVTAMTGATLDLRPVDADDARLLWEWANDGEVRRQAFSPDPIGWDEHVSWLQARLADERSSLYVGSDAAGPVGLVRFAPATPERGPDTRPGGAGPAEVDQVEIGVVVAPERRGDHRGAALIDAGVTRFFAAGGPGAAAPVLARIKPENTASQRAFLAADFDADGAGSGEGQEWLRYTRTRHGVS